MAPLNSEILELVLRGRHDGPNINAGDRALLNYAQHLSGCADPTRAPGCTTTTDGHLPDTRASHSSDRLEYLLGCAHLVCDE